jgi:hypothetical protein
MADDGNAGSVLTKVAGNRLRITWTVRDENCQLQDPPILAFIFSAGDCGGRPVVSFFDQPDQPLLVARLSRGVFRVLLPLTPAGSETWRWKWQAWDALGVPLVSSETTYRVAPGLPIPVLP